MLISIFLPYIALSLSLAAFSVFFDPATFHPFTLVPFSFRYLSRTFARYLFTLFPFVIHLSFCTFVSLSLSRSLNLSHSLISNII